MRAHSLYYATTPNDGTVVTHSQRTSTLSADAVLASKGSNLTFSGAPTVPWAVGDVGVLSDGTKDAYCVVTKITSTTAITVRPLQITPDSAGIIGHTFAAAAPTTFTSSTLFRRSVCHLVVDLSDVPEGLYDYVVVGSASFSHDTASNVRINMRSMCLLDDQRSGGVVSNGRFTRAGTAGDPYTWVGSTRVRLTAGQRYEFHIEAGTAGSDATATMKYSRLVAIRYSSAVVASAHNGDSAAETNATGSYVTSASLGSNALAAGDSLVVATWASSNSDTGQDLEVELVDGSTQIAYQKSRVGNVNDEIPCGFFGIRTFGDTNDLKIRFKTAGGATATLNDVQLCAIPVSAIPALAGSAVSAFEGSNYSVTDTSTFTTAKASASVSLESGTHLEIISCGIAGSDEFIARPAFSGAEADTYPNQGEHGATLNLSASYPIPTFWFARNERPTEAATNLIQAKVDDATGTVTVYNPRFTWIREKPPLVPMHNTPITIIAEIENGGMLLKNWTASGGRHYSDLDANVDEISRVIVNGTEYTEEPAGTGSMSDGEWYFDSSIQRVWIDMPSGTSPNDPDQIVIVVPLIRLGREHEDLTNSAGAAVPYDSKLQSVPSVSEELRSSDGRVEATTQFGTVSIAAGDRYFDDIIGQRHYQGYRCTTKRGYRTLSKRLDDFATIASAVMDLPSLSLTGDPSYLKLRLFDRGLNLDRPVSVTQITVKEGNSTDTSEVSRDEQPLPVIYGTVKGVSAYRVTKNYGAGTYNTYRFAGHAVSSVTALFRDAELQTKIGTSHYTASATYLAAGSVYVRNTAFEDPDKPLDVIYLTIVGRTSDGTTAGTALTTAGAIARDILTVYPMRYDETLGTPATTIDTTNHTSGQTGADCRVAATTDFALGDRVRVVSHAAATTYYHAIVTAILSGPARLTLVPLYETGDAAIGASFTAGASSSVRKTGSAGGLAGSQLVESTFRLLDRRWRRQAQENVGPIPTPVNLGFMSQDDESVGDAVRRLLGDVFAWLRLSHHGRAQVGVMDVDAGNLAENIGLEDSTNGTYPWTAAGSGSITGRVTAPKYDGSYSLEIANGSSASGRIVQQVALPTAGTYVLTLLAAAKTAQNTAFRVGVVLPSGELALGDAETIVTQAWRRKSFAFEVPQGYAGNAWIYIYPAHGSSSAISCYLDNVELYRVVAIADRTNSRPDAVEFSDEHYYEAAVTFDVNAQNAEFASRVVRNDREAKGLALGTPSEGKFAVPSSKRVDLGEPLITDVASAAGIAGALASYYSRPRMLLEIDLLGLSELPSVGDYLFHRSNPRIPELENRGPVHRIVSVDYDPDDAQVVSVVAERQIDPVADRATIT